MNEDLMTPAVFGGRIDKSYDWVIRNYRSIPHRRIGRSVRFTEQDLNEYLESRRVAPASMRSKPRKK